MPDYSKSVIYRLDCLDLVYVGSTTQGLAVRKAEHHKRFKSGTLIEKSYLLYDLAEKNELSLSKDITIELIEECPCDNRDQLKAIEGKWIRQFKKDYGDKCVNKQIAGRSKKQYQIDNEERLKEYRKKYGEINREQILEKKKKYYQENKETFAIKGKEYKLKNSDKIKKNKSEKIVCECGCLIARNHLARHKKTKKHLEMLDNIA
jgi:hypothetical protein